jgi:hypothetical protein
MQAYLRLAPRWAGRFTAGMAQHLLRHECAFSGHEGRRCPVLSSLGATAIAPGIDSYREYTLTRCTFAVRMDDESPGPIQIGFDLEQAVCD